MDTLRGHLGGAVVASRTGLQAIHVMSRGLMQNSPGERTTTGRPPVPLEPRRGDLGVFDGRSHAESALCDAKAGRSPS